ncbi:recombinase family protein [Streptomyces mexicanus]|jgi:DNA invertase Pin-like site-specific DNA recombinase|uniref:Recombinase family protein n=1 Tax=Streptomyces mexicanus TaxID=178566 RepID=A0A7X1LP22_9ACTN|nr:recombinase family protein [Streptomyces mexicanus]MBC2864428.1 recombinase family protein [Streptomyces mexicanus]
MNTRPRVIIPAAQSVVAAELIPVIGYARVSTWREEMISIDIQKSVVEDAAARRGRYVAEWIIDEDATGRNFKRKVMRAIEIVEDHERPERELWSWKFSRFGRNRHGVAINLARIENVGGELISATEDVDAKTAVGRFTRGMLLEVAAFESDRAGEQWKETHELRRRLGLPAAGGRRFGYRWYPRRIPDGRGGWAVQEERYEVLPNEAELAVDAFQDYIKGKTGFGKIAERWNDLGFLNTRGAPWQDQGVRGYMDSGFTAGLLYVHNPEAPCGDPAGCKNAEHYTYLAAEHESVINGDEWDNYRDMRTVRRNTPRRALSPVYPLAGLVRCGLCGSAAMNHQTRRERGYAYRCGARARRKVQHDAVWVRRTVVEGRVLEWLVDLRKEIDDIVAGKIAVPKPRREPDFDKKRKKLQREIEKATAAMQRAFEAYTLGDVSRDVYLSTRAKHEDRRNEAQRQLDELPSPDKEPPSPVPHRETVIGLLAEWDTISVHSKRVTLGRLIRRVEIRPDDDVTVVPVWAPADPPLKKGPGRPSYRPE